MKHRTQILLEDWQYQSLQEMARRMKTSLSSLIRSWIVEKVRPKDRKKNKGLLRFAGQIKDQPDVAREHDRYLDHP